MMPRSMKFYYLILLTLFSPNLGTLAFKFTEKTIKIRYAKGIYVYAMAFVQNGKWFLEAIQSKPFSSFFKLVDILDRQKLSNETCSGQ